VGNCTCEPTPHVLFLYHLLFYFIYLIYIIIPKLWHNN
jgi:hypothetical protein